MDLELELEHFIYIFLVPITWLIMTFWGRAQFNILYSPVPALAQTMVTVSFWIGGVGIALAIGLVIYTLSE